MSTDDHDAYISHAIADLFIGLIVIYPRKTNSPLEKANLETLAQ